MSTEHRAPIRLWAPSGRAVDIVVDDHPPFRLLRDGQGVHTGDVLGLDASSFSAPGFCVPPVSFLCSRGELSAGSLSLSSTAAVVVSTRSTGKKGSACRITPRSGC